jgi:hypothetical protein
MTMSTKLFSLLTEEERELFVAINKNYCFFLGKESNTN